MATSRRAIAFSRVDFPAFGEPTRTIVSPSRSRSPEDSESTMSISAARDSRPRDGPVLEPRGNIVLIREIQGGFERRESGDAVIAPSIGLSAKMSIELQERLPALGLRFGIDEIRQAFDLRQIHSAVEKGTARELARFGGPQSLQARQGSQHGRAAGETSMDMQLRLVLPGEAPGTRHPCDEGLIEWRAVGALQGPESQSPGIRHSPGETFEQPLDRPVR